MRVLSYLLVLVFVLLSVPMFGQQPHLKWNPDNKKLEKLNSRMTHLNDRLNKQNAAITQRIREAYPTRYDSLIQSLYQPSEGGSLSKTEALKSEVATLSESMNFALGQEGTNEAQKKLDLMKGEMQLLNSQSNFLENLSASDLDLESLDLDKSVQKGLKELNSYDKLLDDYKVSVKNLDRSLEQYVSKHPEVAAFKTEYEELKALEKNQSFLRSDSSGLQTKAVVQEAMSKHLGVAKNKVNEFVNGQISKANESVDKLKKKYDQVQNSGAISKAEKNPMAELPLKYRLVYQTNASVNRGDLSALDIQFNLGYRINPKMTIGFGASQRTALGRDWESIDIRHQGWGYRFYYDYSITRNFFIQASYEYLNTRVTALDTKVKDFSQWRNGGLIGLGRIIQLGVNSTSSVLIMYNLINRETSQFGSPWVIRFGFNFNKKNQ